jgi:hypothetical protein
MCPRNLTRTLSTDLGRFIRGLELSLNVRIQTGRWGNGAEAPYSPDSESLLLSEKMKDDSDMERVELKEIQRIQLGMRTWI